jgi:chorismate mutase
MFKPAHSHFSFFIFHSSFLYHFSFFILHFSFFSTFLLAQQSAGILVPLGTLTNQTNDTLFCLPKQKLETLIDREETNAQLVDALEERVELCDSALEIKSREADGWYGRLIETDQLLEESEFLRVQEEQKDRRKTKTWFGVGTVAGILIGMVL